MHTTRTHTHLHTNTRTHTRSHKCFSFNSLDLSFSDYWLSIYRILSDDVFCLQSGCHHNIQLFRNRLSFIVSYPMVEKMAFDCSHTPVDDRYLLSRISRHFPYSDNRQHLLCCFFVEQRIRV